MAIRSADIRSYRGARVVTQSLSHATRTDTPTAFLSHSHKDRELAEGVQAWFKSKGWNVYIDWQDEEMPPRPTRATAEKIQNQIERRNLFLYLATENSARSRWCPWEIGYADKAKGKSKLLIIPTQDARGTNHGNEYLSLYRRIDLDGMLIRFFEPGSTYGQSLNALSWR